MALASFLAAMTAVTVADPDLWGHLRFGLDILENGSINQVDHYSYLTSGDRWINHEWLSELLFAISWKAGAVPGLIWLKMATILLMFGVVYRHLRSAAASPMRAGILILILFEVLMPFVAAVRPYIFTALLFSVFLYLICRAEAGHYRWLWLTPPSMALWTNLHGGFLAGLGILLIWSTLHLLWRRRSFLNVAPPVFLAILATLLNPYHMDLLVFLARTATVARPEITDWQPMQWNSLLGILDLTLLSAALIGIVVTRRRRKPVLLILFCVTALLPFVAVRHILLSAIGSVMLAGEHMADGMERFLSRNGLKTAIRPWYPIVPALLSISLLVWRADSFRRITLVENFYPVKAVALLKQSGVAGNLAAHFPWGEYAIWHLGPGVKIAVDGRRETVYSAEVYQRFLQFQYGLDDWDALLTQYPTDMVLVHRATPCYRLMSSRGDWPVAYEDSISAIFVRNKETGERIRRTDSAL